MQTIPHISTPAYAPPCIHPGETPEQRAARIAARDQIGYRLAKVRMALARLDVLGITVYSVDLRTDIPQLDALPNWRNESAGAAWTESITLRERRRRCEVHGCILTWAEPLEFPARMTPVLTNPLTNPQNNPQNNPQKAAA